MIDDDGNKLRPAYSEVWQKLWAAYKWYKNQGLRPPKAAKAALGFVKMWLEKYWDMKT